MNKLLYKFDEQGQILLFWPPYLPEIIGHLYTYIKTDEGIFSSEKLHWEITHKQTDKLLIRGWDNGQHFEQFWTLEKDSNNSLKWNVEIILHKTMVVDIAYIALACDTNFWFYNNSYNSGIFPSLKADFNKKAWEGSPDLEGTGISKGTKDSPLIQIIPDKDYFYSGAKFYANGFTHSNEIRYYRIDNIFGSTEWHPGDYTFFIGTITVQPDKGWINQLKLFLDKIHPPQKVLVVNTMGQGFSSFFSNELSSKFNCEVINLCQSEKSFITDNVPLALPALSESTPKGIKIKLFSKLRKEIKQQKPDMVILFVHTLKAPKEKFFWGLCSSISTKQKFVLDTEGNYVKLQSLPTLTCYFAVRKFLIIAWFILRILLIPFELVGLAATFIWLFLIEIYYSMRGIRHKTN